MKKTTKLNLCNTRFLKTKIWKYISKRNMTKLQICTWVKPLGIMKFLTVPNCTLTNLINYYFTNKPS